MKKKHHTTEQIIRILREAEGSQMKAEEVCRKHSISPQTYYRWKSKYGGMDLKEAQRLRELERENGELKKLLADQLLKTKALEMALEKPLSLERQRRLADRIKAQLSCSGAGALSLAGDPPQHAALPPQAKAGPQREAGSGDRSHVASAPNPGVQEDCRQTARAGLRGEQEAGSGCAGRKVCRCHRPSRESVVEA